MNINIFHISDAQHNHEKLLEKNTRKRLVMYKEENFMGKNQHGEGVLLFLI